MKLLFHYDIVGPMKNSNIGRLDLVAESSSV